MHKNVSLYFIDLYNYKGDLVMPEGQRTNNTTNIRYKIKEFNNLLIRGVHNTPDLVNNRLHR